VENTVGTDYVSLSLAIENTGTARVEPSSFSVGFTYFTGASTSGTLDSLVVAQVMDPGFTYKGIVTRQLPASGMYTIYATLDVDNTINESNEEDNEAVSTWTVP